MIEQQASIPETVEASLQLSEALLVENSGAAVRISQVVVEQRFGVYERDAEVPNCVLHVENWFRFGDNYLEGGLAPQEDQLATPFTDRAVIRDHGTRVAIHFTDVFGRQQSQVNSTQSAAVGADTYWQAVEQPLINARVHTWPRTQRLELFVDSGDCGGLIRSPESAPEE